MKQIQWSDGITIEQLNKRHKRTAFCSGVDMVDEWLKTAKKYYHDLAIGLADSGHPNLAAIVETLNDLFIPGSSLEAAIEIIPMTTLSAGLLFLNCPASSLRSPSAAADSFFLCIGMLIIAYQKMAPLYSSFHVDCICHST